MRPLAFEVSNVESITEDLPLQGICSEPIRVDEFTNKNFTFFQYPDGLPIEIYKI